MTSQMGVLLINLGTPTAPTASAVRRYLAEFLSDPRVVEIPSFIWLPLLYMIILPLRARRSALLYQQIWQQTGSPLLHFTTMQATQLQQQLDPKAQNIRVEFAMRYGQPSIHSRLAKLMASGVKRLVILPMYPQYAAATTGTAFDEVSAFFKTQRFIPSLHWINDYATEPGYIQALVTSIKQTWQTQGKPQLLLFSFHGLPERCVSLGDPYAKRCHATADALTQALSAEQVPTKIVFQSRFGKARWLQPYCASVLQSLPQEGIKNVQVICPGFSADCLETLQEIEIENKHIFLQAGGEQFHYIPALNATPDFINALSKIVIDQQNDK